MIFPHIFAYVPWRHHVEIITRCKSVIEALFYIKVTIDENLSRNALIDYIKSDYYNRVGNAITNFSEKLPDIQGKLAQEIVKDNYDLSFISLPRDYDEKRLEEVSGFF